ncbi:MAG: phosphoglucosamine mutase [Actinobacteria bacterium]|uniref:Phosphoglucosamine mutase n=1 Tax=Candidatus Fonsibacter lacus TaxID=2576439 RepID=A0A965GD57_9PROT|nr:phosphoglucosamine mutase [Candidatus Fonsibacter lacus]
MALFGTDGIRGRFGEFLTTDLAERVSYAAGKLLPHRSQVIIGRDPRESGLLLERAITAGFTKAGHDVIHLGVIPTPGLAFLTLEPGIALGVMITASHNPASDNGIKIFGHDGMKIPDQLEEEIETWVASSQEIPTPELSKLGTSKEDSTAIERYIAHLKSSIDVSLSGLNLVVDCAHGAASLVAPRVLQELGASVHVIGGAPNGININENVGSTHLDVLQRTMSELNADLGIAHDNLGFHKKMAEVGISVEITNVGDRYVLERINERDLSLGGEQSGHIIIRRLSTTGDGILTALAILALVKRNFISADSLANIFHNFPQVLKNVAVTDKLKALADEEVKKEIAKAEDLLGTNGRILVRASGTEDLMRVMAEAATMERAQSIVESIADVLIKRFGIK